MADSNQGYVYFTSDNPERAGVISATLEQMGMKYIEMPLEKYSEQFPTMVRMFNPTHYIVDTFFPEFDHFVHVVCSRADIQVQTIDFRSVHDDEITSEVMSELRPAKREGGGWHSGWK
jgi:hypothetical protein